VLRWFSVFTIFVVLTGFAGLLIVGHYPLEGRTLASVVSRGHGVHLGDLVVLAGWASGMVALVTLARGAGTRRSSADCVASEVRP
jgi:hypothetical protein